MDRIFNHTYFKFLTRFLIIVGIGLVGALLAGYFNNQESASTSATFGSEEITTP